MQEVLVAKHAFVTYDKTGGRVYVRRGETVDPDHWLVAAYPDAFEPLTIKHNVPARPAQKPASKPAA
jgi:hypothetical protein